MVEAASDPLPIGVGESRRTAEVGQPPLRSPQQRPARRFQQVLQQAVEGQAPVRFSKHAQHRLATRGVHLTAEALNKLQGAVDRAAAKGARDSLVLMDDLALVVSIRNRTVITAVDAASRRDNVFTNVDSVVFTE